MKHFKKIICREERLFTGKQGFTVIEFLIVVSILIILLALLIPSFSKLREMGRRTQCMSNLRQIGIAMRLYAADYKGAFPPDGAPPNTWASYIYPRYMKEEKLFDCPTHDYVGTIATGPDYWYQAGLTLDSLQKDLLVGCYDGCHYGYENKLVVSGKVYFLLPGATP